MIAAPSSPIWTHAVKISIPMNKGNCSPLLWSLKWNFTSHTDSRLQIKMRYNTPIKTVKNPKCRHEIRETMWKKQEFSFTGRKANMSFRRQCNNFFQNQTYSYHAIQLSCSLVYTQRSWKLMSTQRPAHINVYSSFIPNCQKLGGAKMSFSKWMDKVDVKQWNIVQH